jgi:hypothetical protein
VLAAVLAARSVSSSQVQPAPSPAAYQPARRHSASVLIASVQFISQRSVQASVPFRPAFRSGQRSVQPAFRSGQRCPSVQSRPMSERFRPVQGARPGQATSNDVRVLKSPELSECVQVPERCPSAVQDVLQALAAASGPEPRRSVKSECRSGSPNDVRVPFRTSPGLRQAASQRTVQPAFRSGQRSVQASVPFSQRTVSPDPRTMSECLSPRNDVRVLFRLPPGLHQAATRSSPVWETMSECLSPRNDVRGCSGRRQRPIASVISVVLRAIALSSMRSSEVSVAQAIALSSANSACLSHRIELRSAEVLRSPRNDVRVLFRPSPASPERCPSAVQDPER